MYILNLYRVLSKYKVINIFIYKRYLKTKGLVLKY